MTTYSLVILLFQFWTSPLFDVWFSLLLLDLLPGFSGNRKSNLVFPSLKNFPQFIVITVKGFGIVNEAEVDVFLEFSCFFYDPTDVGNLISGSSAFCKSSLNIWKFLVLLLAWRILSITWWVCKMRTVIWQFAFPWDWNENGHFPVLWPLLHFPNLLAYWV